MLRETLPPPSPAEPIGTMHEASAAEAPPPLPPGLKSGFQGFRVRPHARDEVIEEIPNSGMAVLPRNVPSARCQCAGHPLRPEPVLYTRSDPLDVGTPAQLSKSFTSTGTPSSRPHPIGKQLRPLLAELPSSARQDQSCRSVTAAEGLARGRPLSEGEVVESIRVG